MLSIVDSLAYFSILLLLLLLLLSSSFQQLNFYSFRKIKYSNSIRIDYETEKRTANYWRFRHEHFQQGRPDLLVHIKRTNGKGSSNNNNTNNAATATKAVAKQPDAVVSATATATTNSAPVATAVADKSEVQSLKQRIDEMSKNMDALTEMVQKVSLQQQPQETEEPGVKRKKLSVEEQASPTSGAPVPDGALSAAALPAMMDLDDMPLPEGVGSMELLAAPAALPLAEESRESSMDSNEFVDQLFSAFQDDDELLGPMVDGADDQNTMLNDSEASSNDDGNNNSNRPDPELMKRLSDALEMLPKETQELIVNRLIAAITSTDFLASKVPTSEPKKVAAAGKAPPKMEDEPQPQPQQPTALAAATFAALLQHYTNQIKENNNSRSKSEAASSANKKQLQKTIPVIPVHA